MTNTTQSINWGSNGFGDMIGEAEHGRYSFRPTPGGFKVMHYSNVAEYEYVACDGPYRTHTAAMAAAEQHSNVIARRA